MSNKIWIVDTSVLCNILAIPNRDQDYDRVKRAFEDRIKNGDRFLLPYTTVIETGNHIGHSKGDRKRLAIKFVKLVQSTLCGEAPWKMMKAPKAEEISVWLKDFHINAEAGKGYGDHSIIKEWEECRTLNKGYSVSIWSLDSDLAGYHS